MSDATGLPHVECGTFTLSREEGQALWDAAMQAKAERNARLPDEQSCIVAIHDGFTRLKDFGWRDPVYAPKHAPLDLIEAGSTGIHHGYRDDIGFWIQDDDTWPSRPTLARWIEKARWIDKPKLTLVDKTSAEATP